ncbi:MAG TPA: alpha-amylase family glycosyl hydrolase [Bacteroidota bacterium]|nr:alpha-amylase family glycosyl hydrolase [Bacteroidota bacterium]
MIIRLTRFPEWPDPGRKEFPLFEFHIRSGVRRKYGFDDSLYTSSGNVIFPNFRAVRAFAQKMNALRDLKNHPELAIKAGKLNAMALIDEILHYVLRIYEERANPNVFSRALSYLRHHAGESSVHSTILEFVREVPPLSVHRGSVAAEKYVEGSTAGKPHRENVLEEIILFHLANLNPSFRPFIELFDDSKLSQTTGYTRMMHELEAFFRSELPFGPEGTSVLELLRAPMRASPESLEGQLAYIKTHWGLILGEKFMKKILGAYDLIEEESKPMFSGGRGPTVVPDFRGEGGTFDLERFTDDRDWMPSVVIIAKNTYVWLDQLSRKYRRSITALNQIPDEELDQLARWNFTGLWLIGIWERSSASQKIKQMTGNPEAVSSAYSLYDYDIARDLGGEDAFQNLRHRAWVRGIRLAGDMVPNHVGIYSRWVIEHPEFFVQSDFSPFPGYQFTGPNLSEHPDIDLRIEDGYWTRKDAAVVFQRVDRRSGNVRYFYHGNDGTNMPWNDTAQLNFLRADVREAVIEKIFQVARKFSIIRFDAAMVLTKRHFQRLWFPQPGTGGAIPSRADAALPADEFERAFPAEFWREVVDRINQDLPHTLLLAEAFWLLEGYFVRTLGMHRVYNSAFMHMLMNEENAKYRHLIRATLHFNPEILKRYVNFMSNPDEQTAINQFGKDDKYFGVAVMMVTLPGLPMFAHGQIEGYAEKYGMEYKRAYYDEVPDEHLVRRHEREIFPIMQKRHLFSQVSDFEMYDFIDSGGRLNENVFAYSNMTGSERALICYHNKYEETSGWIHDAVGKTTAAGGDEEGKFVVRRSIGQALHLKSEGPVYYLFRDFRSNLEFIRSGRELSERGIFVELKAFHYYVFLDFREVFDTTGEYASLERHLGGRGVPDILQEFRDLQLAPLHEALSRLCSRELLGWLADIVGAEDSSADVRKSIQDLSLAFGNFADQVRCRVKLSKRKSEIESEFGDLLNAVRLLYHHPFEKDSGLDRKFQRILTPLLREKEISYSPLGTAISLLTLYPIIGSFESADASMFITACDISRSLEKSLAGVESDPSVRAETAGMILLVATGENPFLAPQKAYSVILASLQLERFREYLKVNTFEGTTYFNKERFEHLLEWYFWMAAVSMMKEHPRTRDPKRYRDSLKMFEELRTAAGASGYRLAEFQKNLSGKKLSKSV